MVRTVYICITIYGIIIDSIVSHRKTTELCELADKIVYVLNQSMLPCSEGPSPCWTSQLVSTDAARN